MKNEWVKKRWNALKAFLHREVEYLGYFFKDLQINVYDQLQKVMAIAFVAFFTAILFYIIGGYGWKRFWNDIIDEEENYVTRKIIGQVYDGQSDYPVQSVKVGVLGQQHATDTTNQDGYFELTFMMHLDSTTVILTFSHPQYKVKSKQYDVPLDGDTANHKADFVIYRRSSKQQPIGHQSTSEFSPKLLLTH